MIPKLRTLLNETITSYLPDEVENDFQHSDWYGKREGKKLLKKLAQYKPIPLGKYIGSCTSHKCDTNAAKMSKQGYDLYNGFVITIIKGKLDNFFRHTFNVKDGKIHEFTAWDIPSEFKKSIYVGKKIDSKDIKKYQYLNMKKYEI